MNECKKCRKLFAESLYEELSGEWRKFVKDHLVICEKCKSEYGEMEATLKIMNQKARPDPGKTFWEGYTDRLAKRMEEEDSSILHSPISRGQIFIRTLKSVPRWAFQASAALLLVILGIVIGRLLFSPSVSEIQLAQQSAVQESRIDVIHRAQDYIERSKLIILAMVNFDSKTEDPYGLNLPYQKQVSKELVQEASFLKEKLTDTRQKRLQKLIMDLEIILLQIANLESEHNHEAIELVKEGVESRGILLKIHLADIRKFTEVDKAEPETKGLNKSREI